MQVLKGALPMTFMVEFWVVAEAILHGAAHDGLGLDVAVGLGEDASQQGAWLRGGGGAVVFGSLGYELYLLFAEPASQVLVGTDDAA